MPRGRPRKNVTHDDRQPPVVDALSSVPVPAIDRELIEDDGVEADVASDGSDFMVRSGDNPHVPLRGGDEHGERVLHDGEEAPSLEWSVPIPTGTLRHVTEIRRNREQPLDENVQLVTDQQPESSPFQFPAPHTAVPEFVRPNAQQDASEPTSQVVLRNSPEAMDPLTARIGAKWFTDGAKFDWCREGPFNISPAGELDSRPRHTFTRYYQMDSLLVDVFKRDSERVRAEVVEKTRAIRAYSVVQQFGYLPVVKGSLVSNEAIERAKAGEILPLQVDANLPTPVEGEFTV